MTDPPDPTSEPKRPATEFLAEIRRGTLLDTLTNELHALIGDVIATEKTGELRLVLKVKPAADMQIEVTGDVITKRPRPPAPVSIFYVDRHGRPTRHDPYQQTMFQEEPTS